LPNPSLTPRKPHPRRSTIQGMAAPSKRPPLEPPTVLGEQSGERSTIVPEFDPEDFACDSDVMRRQALERECLAAIGSESAILVVAVFPEELKRIALDNVSGFLLSAMDGATDVETILDISCLPRLLALRYMRSLLQRGVVVVAAARKAL
jgi:hypothetical protein